MEGRVLQSTRCYHPIHQAKEEWKVFRSLSNKFNESLKFNNIEELRKELFQNYPLFQELNILPKQDIIKFGKKIKINERIIKNNINNFYMTDNISRSSITMARCSKEILNKVA